MVTNKTVDCWVLVIEITGKRSNLKKKIKENFTKIFFGLVSRKNGIKLKRNEMWPVI